MNKKQIRLTESDLKQIVKESVNRIVKESDELDANDWKDIYLKNAHYPNEPVDMKDIENKASWDAFDGNVNSLYGQRGCYDDDYASQAYADDPLSDFYGLENKNAYDLKGYLAKRKLAKNESKNMNKKLFKLTESDLHRIVKRAINETLANQQSVPNDMAGEFLTDEQFYENNWYDFKVCVDAMVSKIEKLESAKQNNISIRHYADDIQKCLYKLNKMWPSIKSMYLNLKYPDYPIDDLKYSRKVDAKLGYDK